MTTPNDDPRARLRRSVYLLLIALGTGAIIGRILALDAVDRTAVQEHYVSKGASNKSKALAKTLKEKLKKEGLSGKKLEERLAEELEKALAKEKARLRSDKWIRRPFLSANDRSRWCTVRALVEKDMRVIEVEETGKKTCVPYAIDNVIEDPDWDTIDKVKHGRRSVKHHGHFYSSKPPLFPTLVAGEYWLIYRLTGMSLDSHPFVVGRFMLITINVIPLLIYFVLLARLIERFGTTDWGRMFVMGAAVFGTFLSTFAVTLNNHLPAAVCAVIALYAAVRIWFDGERRLRYFVIAGFFAAFLAANEFPAAALLAVLSLALLCKAPLRTIVAYLPAVVVVAAGFFGTNWIAHKNLLPPYMHRGEGDNWYDYEGSHLSTRETRSGIDRGEDSPAVYALHVLVGHHGVFSLTPVWLLSAAGVGIWLCKGPDRRLRALALLIGGLSLLCLIFYLNRPLLDRNYGGMTCGFRWMFWLAPLWLITMLPAADAMDRRWWTRGICLLLLAVSVLSASYPTWNPWTNPWLWDYFRYMGWIVVPGNS